MVFHNVAVLGYDPKDVVKTITMAFDTCGSSLYDVHRITGSSVDCNDFDSLDNYRGEVMGIWREPITEMFTICKNSANDYFIVKYDLLMPYFNIMLIDDFFFGKERKMIEKWAKNGSLEDLSFYNIDVYLKTFYSYGC